MSEAEQLKIFANIESETGLAAFKVFMEYKWAVLYLEIAGKCLVAAFIASLLVYLCYLSSKKKEVEK